MPPRVIVNVPVSGPISDAFGSVAVTVTVCGLSAIVTVATLGDPIVYSGNPARLSARSTVSGPSAPKASKTGVTVTVVEV